MNNKYEDGAWMLWLGGGFALNIITQSYSPAGAAAPVVCVCGAYVCMHAYSEDHFPTLKKK